jgi:hypothetical protein
VSSFSSTAVYPLDDLGFGNSGNDDQTERHTTQSNFRADTNLTFVNCGTIVDNEPT